MISLKTLLHKWFGKALRFPHGIPRAVTAVRKPDSTVRKPDTDDEADYRDDE